MRTFRLSCALFVAAGCLLSSKAAAAIVIADDFNDGNDQGWTHYDPLGPAGGGGTYTVSNGAYRIQAAISPNPALGPGRAGSLRSETTYDDFFSAVDITAWNDLSDQAFGLLGRIRQPGIGTTDGYGFLYVPVDQNFEMERFDDEVDHRIGPIVPLALDPARDYRLTFSASGDTFTAEVFDLADLTTPLITLTAIDAAYNTGVSGLLVADASSAGAVSDATFDNFYSIPEPASLALILAAASCVTTRAFAMRRNAKRSGPCGPER